MLGINGFCKRNVKSDFITLLKETHWGSESRKHGMDFNIKYSVDSESKWEIRMQRDSDLFFRESFKPYLA